MRARIALVGLVGQGLKHVAKDRERALGEEGVEHRRVEVSGISFMSDSLITFQPAIEEPSNMMPSEKASSSIIS